MLKSCMLALSVLVISAGAYAMMPLVEFKQPYAFATSEVQKNGAAFMTIRNNQPTPLKLVSARTDVAERVELHTHIMDGDMMMMREVESFEVGPNGAEHVLKPMADHIMLMGLKAPLVEDEIFTLTLTTEDGQDFNVNVEIVAPGTKPDSVVHIHHDHGHAHDKEGHHH